MCVCGEASGMFVHVLRSSTRSEPRLLAVSVVLLWREGSGCCVSISVMPGIVNGECEIDRQTDR